MRSDLPTSDIDLYVVHVLKVGVEGFELYLNVLGGYTDGETTMILYRDVADGMSEAKDGIAKLILGQGGIRMGDHNDLEYLTDNDWTRFGLLEPNAEFRLGGNVWKKLDKDELRKLVHNKSLVVI